MEHLSDKELLRQGRYVEALGENYNGKPIYVMIFEGTKKYKKVRTYEERPNGNGGYWHNKQVIVDNDCNDEGVRWFGHCIGHLKDKNGVEPNFYTVEDAKSWIKNNTEPLPDNQWYCFGNHNADWL